MVEVMETHIRDLWDNRHWDVALKSNNTLETYNQIKADIAAAREGSELESMSQEQRDWYRSS